MSDEITYDKVKKDLAFFRPFFAELVAGTLFKAKSPIWVDGTADIGAFNEIDVIYATEAFSVIFYKSHEKFGENIIEFSHIYLKNDGSFFFDWSKLDELFNHYIIENGTSEFPHIPFYYSMPEDTYFYKKGTADWLEAEGLPIS